MAKRVKVAWLFQMALKITKRTLIEYRMNGKLPYYKIGGKIMYKEQDIIDILERNKVLAFE